MLPLFNPTIVASWDPPGFVAIQQIEEVEEFLSNWCFRNPASLHSHPFEVGEFIP